MSPGPIRRTVHACVQCRERKQKCGGVTADATCLACKNRKVGCSFETEVNDPRYNPYLLIRSASSRSFDARPPQPQVQVTGVADGGPTEVDLLSGDSPRGGQRPDVQLELERLRTELRTLRSAGQGGPNGSFPPPSAPLPLANVSFDHIQPQPVPPPPPPLPPSAQTLDDLASFAAAGPTIYNEPSLTLSETLQPTPQLTLVSSPDASFNGPLKVLQDLGANDALEPENHDPILRQVLTAGEAAIAVRLFFTKCHLNAPFLDYQHDSHVDSLRSRNIALFLNIVVVGARFWSHSSKRDTWLHPRYPRLVALLDQEMARLTLRSRPADICLETVQAWMIYSHWMPIDTSPTGYRSRFSESSIWQCLGLAIRWALMLGLDKTAHLPFMSPTEQPTAQDVYNFRAMLYLTESDYYLALSSRRNPTLQPTLLFNCLPRFMRCTAWLQPTDTRLASLIHVVQAAHVMGGKAESFESLEAFNIDVNAVEHNFLTSASSDPGNDKMRQHFPFTSLRWYRLAFASTLLPPASNWRHAGEALQLSIDWASQMLFHLSSSTPMTSQRLGPESVGATLEPDGDLVRLLSFAIDQYFVVIAYTASFLTLAWQNGAINSQLQRMTDVPQTPSTPRSSTLYRLVDLSARTLRQCAPARDHPASRYANFLEGMANIIATSSTAHVGQQPMQGVNGAGAPVWDQDWWNLWQSAGLEQDWLFGQFEESS